MRILLFRLFASTLLATASLSTPPMAPRMAACAAASTLKMGASSDIPMAPTLMTGLGLRSGLPVEAIMAQREATGCRAAVRVRMATRPPAVSRVPKSARYTITWGPAGWGRACVSDKWASGVAHLRWAYWPAGTATCAGGWTVRRSTMGAPAMGLVETALGAAYIEVRVGEELRASPTHAPAETAKRAAAAVREELSLEYR
mmetsp:Transcript_27733/g.50045  ORF Transcript_27733/g.50045 Transcript_27733/m.50045 type:complete len:201 (-) Transcript_27733:26-628(-)